MWARRLALLAGRVLLPWRLWRTVPPNALAVTDRLLHAGHEAYLVGGCVRDLLLGRRPKDWDLTTSATVPEVLALFPQGRVMGSASVLIPLGGAPYEVTPYRGSQAGGLAEDLARRDLTVNAMALSRRGRLYDPQGGLADLAAGLIRTCGKPEERFGEDPLRMLRAVRLAAQLGGELDGGLAAAIRAMADRLDGVAAERIGAEFIRMLQTARPAWAVEQMRELGLLARFAPELLEMVGAPQNRFHRYTVWAHSLLALALAPPEPVVRLAALLHDMGKPRTASVDEAGDRHFYGHERVGAEMAETLLERLRVDGDLRRRTVHLVRYHMDLHLTDPMTDGAIRRMIRRIGLELMHDLIQLRRADRLASGMREGDLAPETVALLQQVERVLAAERALRVTDLAVNGQDVVASFGRPPGPYVGAALCTLLDEVADDPALNERAYLLRRLAELAAEEQGERSEHV